MTGPALVDRGGASVPRRVAVTVRATDPLDRAAVGHLLEREAGLDVVPALAADPLELRATVTVLVAGRLDLETRVELRRSTRGPGCEVVLVVEMLRGAELMTVLRAGVRGVLWRHEVNGAELATTVRAAARRESRLPADLVALLMAHVGRVERARVPGSPRPPSAPSSGLEPREIEVLRLLAEGLDTRGVAGRLAYSERTIKNTVHGLTTRLHLRNRTHAVAYALREGYL